jgi:hypothetical protein
MEVLLVIGGIWLAIWLVVQIIKHAYKAFQPTAPSRPEVRPGTRVHPRPARTDVYRPRPAGPGRSPIVFPNSDNNTASEVPTEAALEGLHDAFTGAKLNPALGLFQCTNCKVYYHVDSVTVLRAENNGQCVACGTAHIVSLTVKEATASRGRDYNPDAVTLANFRSHFNRVVTFEGMVREVRVSKRGKDYAAMFEQTSWSKGLKLVFFRGSVGEVGGPRFIKGLNGKNVRVRGLLINHRIFGPEIIITEQSMMLDVR